MNPAIIRTFGLLIILLMNVGAAQSATITIQSAHSGMYIQTINGTYAASARDVNRAVHFEKIQLPNGSTAFFDVDANKYVRAGIGSGTLVGGYSSTVAGWETFDIQNLGQGLVAIRSAQNNKFIRAGIGQLSHLAAVSNAVGGWEKFRFHNASNRDQAQAAPETGFIQPGLHQSIIGLWDVTGYAAENGQLYLIDDGSIDEATIQIDANGNIEATAGCNTITGRIMQTDNWLTTPNNEVMITRRGCANRTIHLTELSMFRAIRDVQEFSNAYSSTDLLLQANGQDLLRISRR